ncbi:hypothetical protein GCM10009623_30710 [Nocardioides aestuarii]|uniref:Sulfotransferase family protein n=1 Tax=Nocardioides aestuarii TaxID=252231 RepID=A0ABW4TQM3_9ACTN
MARRLFLHVGTMKSGTSYLQSLWWQNHRTLAERGLLLPGDRRGVHFHAATEVCGRADVRALMSEEHRGSWDRVRQEAAASDTDVLVSHELFSRATPDEADTALRELERVSEEVHVVLTARDLSRQLASSWQQDVKQGSTDTLEHYWRRAADDTGRTGEFWTLHDVPAILERWSRGLPDDRVHLVVLPGPGAPRDWLWRAVCELTGVDPAGLDDDAQRSNDSLGLAEVEVLRRVQASLPPESRHLETTRFLKGFFTRQVLAGSGDGERFVLGPERHAWARSLAEDQVADLRTRPWHVVGDVADLLPPEQPLPGRTPEEVSAEEVADAAVNSLVGQLLRSHEQRDRVRSLREEVRRLRGSS